MLFKELKELFIAEPILKIYTLSLLIVVKIDIFNLEAFRQIVPSYILQLYNIYNKELLGIVAALKEQKAFL